MKRNPDSPWPWRWRKKSSLSTRIGHTENAGFGATISVKRQRPTDTTSFIYLYGFEPEKVLIIVSKQLYKIIRALDYTGGMHYQSRGIRDEQQQAGYQPTKLFWIVTATSMINRVNDLYGFLTLLYRPKFAHGVPDYNTVNSFIKVYQDAPVTIINYRYILDPALFKRLLNHSKLDLSYVLIAIPRILNRIQLRIYRC